MKRRKLNKNIYELDAIQSVISLYSDYCKTRLTKTDGYYVIEVADCLYDESQTIDEFCNAVLIETIQGKGSLYD